MTSDDRSAAPADEETLNKGLDTEEDRLRDPDKRTPHDDEESGTEPAREQRGEKEDSDIANMENPPQSDGPRERSNESV